MAREPGSRGGGDRLRGLNFGCERGRRGCDLSYQDCISSNSNQTGCSLLAPSNTAGTNTALDSVDDVAISPDDPSLYTSVTERRDQLVHA